MAEDLAIGPHLSVTGGFAAMGVRATSIGANTFSFFTRNPRGGAAKDIDPEDTNALNDYLSAHEFGRLVAHAPYTYNLCSNKPEVIEFGRESMRSDLLRLEYVPGNYYNFHPGSPVKQGTDRGIELICEGLDEVLDPGLHTTVLLETMAGKGTEVGRSFEELARIIEGTRKGDLLGVCLDTCHVWDAGYDIKGHLDEVLDEFDRIIGLDRLKALHLNDSKNERGSHKDRHERIGEGFLGRETFAAVVSSERINRLPMILETPNELDGYQREIELLRSLKK